MCFLDSIYGRPKSGLITMGLSLERDGGTIQQFHSSFYSMYHTCNSKYVAV